MSKNISSIVAGVGLGLAVTGTGVMIGKSMMGSSSTKRALKKKAAKTFKTMEALMDDIQYMFK